MRLLCTVLAVLLANAPPVYSGEAQMRYRGEYRYGHEVNSFCPAINSRCFWLSPGTGLEARRSLKQLVLERAGRPYEPICVVIEAEINRQPDVSAVPVLARDYDGLITVFQVFGLCSETDKVTQGDLQHRRWVLDSIDGIIIDAERSSRNTPDLDFAASMFVSGHSGCTRFSGWAKLYGASFRVDRMLSDPRPCNAEHMDLDSIILSVIGEGARIALDGNGLLLTGKHGTILRYRLKDWVN